MLTASRKSPMANHEMNYSYKDRTEILREIVLRLIVGTLTVNRRITVQLTIVHFPASPAEHSEGSCKLSSQFCDLTANCTMVTANRKVPILLNNLLT